MDQLKEQAMHAMQSNPSSQRTGTDTESEELDMISAEDITVAIFCALPYESAAVKYTLDKEFGCCPKTIGPRRYVYSFGLIGEHKVVIARPSQMGTVKAAQCAATVSQQFPNVRFALLLGIGAGIPCFPESGSRRDIRLGDVAVSIPRDGHPGVVEYDYGKYEADGTFVLKGSLNKPHPILISADGALQEDEMMEKDRLGRTLKRITKHPRYSRPKGGDNLFDETFRHIQGNGCTEGLESNEKRAIARDTKPTKPVVHRGLILSGSGVVKNSEDRLHLRRGFTDAICFETEAAGIADEIPCLVVRGICDYADSHKQDRWHYYAAAVAAAYGKAILSKIYGEDIWEAESMKEAMAKSDQKLNQLLVTGEETLTVVKDIQYSTSRREIKLDMDKLPYARGAMFSSRNQDHTTCHSRTRVDLLRQIKAWTQMPDSKSIFWLNGSAGTGKSTITWTIAKWLHSEGYHKVVDLGASFFFRRGEADQSSCSRFVPTIVRQLVLKIPGLDGLIAAVVESDPFIFDKSLAEQFNKLLYHPLCKIRISDCPILVVVVDALDECDKESDIKIILELWASMHQITAVRLRLFVTSRPEPSIRFGFKNLPDATYENTSVDEHQNFILCDASRKTTIQHDISTFLDDAFSLFQQNYRAPISKEPLRNGWPGIKDMETLVDMAVPLFIVATTIYRFVTDKNFDPNDQLRKLLEFRAIGSLKPMEQTYLPVLEQLSVAYRNSANEKTLCDESRGIIGSIVALTEPLSKISLANLLQISLDTLVMRLDPLYSVLQIPDDPEMPIRTLHLSFGEFMLSNEPQHKLQVLGPEIHNLLLIKCLQLLSGTNHMEPNGLCENLCDLKYPGQPRRDIALARINQRLSQALQYACQYWIHHAQQGNVELHDGCHVHVFLKNHFLQWLEAMSLLNRITDVIADLNKLRSRIPSHDSIELRAFLEDAQRFVLTHRYVADLAPLQIYSSAIFFTPLFSTIRTIYDRVPKWLREFPITSVTWGPELQKLEGHTGWVNAVVFSQDGSLLASAAADATVRLWNPSTGQELQKLEGHTHPVNAVAFSTDGSLLASVSVDKTVRLWNLSTGQETQKLGGHTDWVNAVAFSHDDSLLASASDDKTIRMWNPSMGQEIQKLEGHTDCVTAVAFSQDGSLLASASHDRTVRLWNTSTRREVQQLEGHTSWVNAVAFSQDGSLLASASADTTVRLWKPSTGQEVQKLKGHTEWVRAVAFSQDGSLLASASHDKTIRLWNPSAGQEVQQLEGHTNWVNAVAFSQDGSLLASASADTTVRLWKPSKGQEMKQLEGHTSWVNAVAFSQDGSLLASASDDKTVRFWNPSTGEEMLQLKGHTDYVKAVTFSQDGSLLASTSHDKTVRLWNPNTGQEKRQLKGHTDWVNAVAFSQDSSLLASASDDKTVRLWNPSTGQKLQQLEGHTYQVNAVAFTQDGSLLASASADATVRLWDPNTGQEVQRLDGHTNWVNAVAFSYDGSLLVSASDDKTIRLWNPSMGREIQKLEGHTDCVTAVAFSQDGSLLASASRDKTVRLWSAHAGQEVQQINGHAYQVNAVAFSQDGSFLASASADATVRLWNLSIGQEMQKQDGHDDCVTAMAFSPDGLLLASLSRDMTVRLWNPHTGEEMRQLKGHTGWVNAVVFSQDGSLLASASKDWTVRLWNPSTGQEIKKLEGHTDYVKAVAFSQDGLLLASASDDKTVKLWNPSTGQDVQLLEGHTDWVNAVVFSHDGSLLASTSEDKTVRLWNPNTGQEIQKLEGHTYPVDAVAFSQDGSLLASASKDWTVSLWNPSTGQEIKKLEGHTDYVKAVAFSQDGLLLASASVDKTVRLWSPNTGEEVRKFEGTGDITTIGFTSDVTAIMTNKGALPIHDRSVLGRDFEPSTNKTITLKDCWISGEKGDFLWLPQEYRTGCSAFHDDTIAIGLNSGHVTFIHFSTQDMI